MEIINTTLNKLGMLQHFIAEQAFFSTDIAKYLST